MRTLYRIRGTELESKTRSATSLINDNSHLAGCSQEGKKTLPHAKTEANFVVSSQVIT